MSKKKSEERQTCEWMEDIRGKKIREGSLVAYPRSSGRCVEMVLGRVIEIFQTRGKVWVGNGYSGKWEDGWNTRLSIKPEKQTRFSYFRSGGDMPEKVIVQNTENVLLLE